MLKLVKKSEQVHTIEVAGQTVTLTIRPAALDDLDFAYVTAIDDTEKLQLEGKAKDNIFALKAGRSMLMQRIIAWEGIYLSETESAPCTPDNLEAFFTQYPGAFRDLSEAVRAQDEGVEKN
jgi:hypothetical protein